VHLVEELAAIIWRKRRALQAEGANINQGLKGSARNAGAVIPAAAPFEMGLSGKGTDIRDLVDLTPEEVTHGTMKPQLAQDMIKRWRYWVVCSNI